MNLWVCVSEDVENEMVALVPFLFVPIVPTVRMTEAEDPVTAVKVAVVRPLNLRDNPLLARIAVPPVVEPAIFETVARDLGRHIRPVQIVGPVLSPR
jgi:hypothetical protein